MPTPTLPAEAPYAYVIEQRPLDRCAPPACSIRSQDVIGWWSELQTDGTRGGYFKLGDTDTEAYYRRAAVTRPGAGYEITLPATDSESEYDGYFAAAEDTEWKADFEVLAPDGAVVLSRALEGTNKATVDATETEDMGRYADYFAHVRIALPDRHGRPLTIRIANVGPAPLAIGSPLVLKKVQGRLPRQAFFVVFDAVPEPLLTRMFTGSGDAQTEWLASTLRDRGTLFTHGVSPGFNTPTFVRRFFRAGFYETDGEPGLYGQGIDEAPKASPPSPVTRLAEQGFETESIAANFLLPTETRLGFDGGYNNEQQAEGKMHPPAVVRRFKDWLTEHPHDDAFSVLWLSITHEPFTAGRPAPPFKIDAPGLDYSQEGFDPIWRNLLMSVDRLHELMESATLVAPDARRVWLIATDHGRTFTTRSMSQPAWLPPHDLVDGDAEHCCLASFEETHTPFAVLYDGAERITPARVDEPSSTSVVWRLLERLYGVQLGLPETRTYSSRALTENDGRWDEGLLASAGDAGSIRAVRNDWAYRSLTIHPEVANAWSVPAATQRMLTGSPNRGSTFVAEELYERSTDPFELRNVADTSPEVVLEFRRKVADWLATYFDPPSHPRYEYSLEFSHPVTLAIDAPRRFFVGIDGHAVAPSDGRKATVAGTKFVFREEDEPGAIVDVAGLAGGGVLRCAATGLPLQVFTEATTRLNFAVARTNCVTSGPSLSLAGADVGFTAKLLKERAVGTGGISSDELIEGLRRWGYVRDLDKSKSP